MRPLISTSKYKQVHHSVIFLTQAHFPDSEGYSHAVCTYGKARSVGPVVFLTDAHFPEGNYNELTSPYKWLRHSVIFLTQAHFPDSEGYSHAVCTYGKARSVGPVVFLTDAHFPDRNYNELTSPYKWIRHSVIFLTQAHFPDSEGYSYAMCTDGKARCVGPVFFLTDAHFSDKNNNELTSLCM